KRVLVGDVYDLVDVFEVNVFRNDLLANAFDQIGRGLKELACFLKSLKHRAVRIGADHSNLLVLLFQIATGSANGPARADARNKMSDSTLGLFPEFRAGRSIVSLGICGIAVLKYKQRVGGFLCDSSRRVDVV